MFVGLYLLAPGILDALAIERPETVVRWHRAGFRSYVALEILGPNPLWRGPRIHGELLKFGIDVGQTSVAKYMARRRGGPGGQAALSR